MWIPATPRRNPTNPDKIPTQPSKSIAKSCRNLVRKIVKLYEKSYQNLVREGPRSLQKRSGTLPERTGAKKTQANDFRQPKNQEIPASGPVLGRFWDPAESPKSTKNGPGSEKVRPETAPEPFFCIFSRRCRSVSVSGAIFVGFSCRCRSESLSGPIFGGSNPSKLCSRHNGSTILTKSPFSKKHRKSNLRGPVLRPKMAKNRRRRPKNRQNCRKKSIF